MRKRGGVGVPVAAEAVEAPAAVAPDMVPVMVPVAEPVEALDAAPVLAAVHCALVGPRSTLALGVVSSHNSHHMYKRRETHVLQICFAKLTVAAGGPHVSFQEA